ncbi:MAG: CYTH domain-containing protein [Smithella sp.]
MPVEIERKFLVQGDDWKVNDGVRISQGYLNLDRERTVRVRIAGDKAFLTIKGINKGATRQEFEYEIPVEDAEQLLKICEGSLIEKTRYKVEYENVTWEIDEFYGANDGLVIAEIELKNEEQKFARPEWLGSEVTEDSRYFNSNLAEKPYLSWSK